jgi:hypothetical protein
MIGICYQVRQPLRAAAARSPSPPCRGRGHAAIAAFAIAAAALIRVCWFRDGSMVVRRCF